MRPLEVTRAGILGTVVVLVAVAVCVRLGLWQLDRRADRLERNAAIAARQAAGPVTLERFPADTAGLTYRRATVRGRLDGERTLVIAGRSYRGQPGVHLYTPVRLGEGAILVNRGWVPAADGATVELASIRDPDTARYAGVLLPLPTADAEPPPPGELRRTWFRVDGAAIRDQLPYPTSELYLLATAGDAGDAGDAGGFGDAGRADIAPVRLGGPALDAGPHLSYAIQWFSFATIFLVGWVVLLLRGRSEPRREHGAAPGDTKA